MSLVNLSMDLKLAKRQCANLKAENEEKDKKIQQLMTILKEERHSVFDLVCLSFAVIPMDYYQTTKSLIFFICAIKSDLIQKNHTSSDALSSDIFRLRSVLAGATASE